MKRSGKILVVCHCLLNANAKIYPLALCGGVYRNALQPYMEEDAGFLQLPCPETIWLGMNRWGMTREQYDHFHFRKYCREMLTVSLAQIHAFVQAGYRIIGVLGMDRSPNCGVNLTCKGFRGGEICSRNRIEQQVAEVSYVPGKGVFMEILEEMLLSENLDIPFLAVDETQAAELITE